jgi:hypothetical protein
MASLFPVIVPAVVAGNAGTSGSNSSQVTAPFVVPYPDRNVTVSVTDTSWMYCGQILYFGDLGYFEVSSIHNSMNVTLKNLTSEWRPVTERDEIHEVIDYDS